MTGITSSWPGADITFLPWDPPHGDPQSPSPYSFRNVHQRVFWVRADRDKLQAICDRLINGPYRAAGSATRYEVFQDLAGNGYLWIVVGSYPHMASLAPGFDDLGYSEQNELVLQIPVIRYRPRPLPVPVSFDVLPIYALVDNDLSLVTGREVIGYPKLWGAFELSADGVLGAIEVDGSVWPKFGPHEKMVRRPVFRATAAASAASHPVVSAPLSEARSLAAPADEAAEPGAQTLWPFGDRTRFDPSGDIPVAEEIRKLMDAAAGVELPGIALRQLRTPAGTEHASYRSLVRFVTRTDPSLFDTGRALEPSEVELYQYDSLRLQDALGIGPGPITPVLEYYYVAGFELRDAVVAAQACGRPALGSTPSTDPCTGLIGDLWMLWAAAGQRHVELCQTAARHFARGPDGMADATAATRAVCENAFGAQLGLWSRWWSCWAWAWCAAPGWGGWCGLPGGSPPTPSSTCVS